MRILSATIGNCPTAFFQGKYEYRKKAKDDSEVSELMHMHFCGYCARTRVWWMD